MEKTQIPRHGIMLGSVTVMSRSVTIMLESVTIMLGSVTGQIYIPAFYKGFRAFRNPLILYYLNNIVSAGVAA